MGFPWRCVAVGEAKPLLLQPLVALLTSGLVKGLKTGLGRCFFDRNLLNVNHLAKSESQL